MKELKDLQEHLKVIHALYSEYDDICTLIEMVDEEEDRSMVKEIEKDIAHFEEDFEKLRIESKFQKLSPGGAISYIEVPSMSHNIPALLNVIEFIYNNIMYAEINTKSCYCEKCGFDGDIPLVEDANGKLKWQCPNCGNDDNTMMDIAFRVCGYIGTAKNGGNQGRYGDIHDRVYHLDDMEYEED